MHSNNDFALIAALDLNPIKKKLMHVESGEGWSLEHATIVESEYRRFLYLMKAFPTEQIAPFEDVDTFWHYHILDTMKYARDCDEVFGYFVHHYPYLGMDEENNNEARQESGDRTRDLYKASFGLTYAHAAAKASWCISPGPGEKAAPVKAAWWIGAGGQGIVKAVHIQSAYCFGTGGPGVVKADARTAWCFGTGGPGIVKAGARTAWCTGTGGPGVLQSA